jgi:ArsR family transcriptional regulator, arsenate/arsenite/antimonite-responsive transcriptional repressor
MDVDRVAMIAKALAHPARVRILQLLAQQTECRGADVFGDLELAQSTVSEHLRVLKDSGLINARPVGTSVVYCIIPGALEPVAQAVAQLTREKPACAPAAGRCS